ncbi:universal stress protein [Nocardioides pocheonensis]|uniref:Universal stress protein n=1 Tax=Nocardioides pocheonensis TaxID=661485 RepID=A0A3N0GLD6_9ACTN|nr:universal stress protein [Nocardioides pocheonensis]RNM12986.1 universal stress protein [Nocardioides pocheonensis]
MTVVVGYLPTPDGLAALSHAIEEVGRTGEKLVVVNTGELGNYAGPSFATPQDLDAIDTQLTEAGIDHLVLQPTNGLSAADEILLAASAHDASRIVIGIRRRSPVGKLFTGSTAQQVLLEADCPVLAVKPQR